VQNSIELLQSTVNEWTLLYGGKTLTEMEFDAWLRIFAHTRPDVLSRALEAVTRESERRPTPGILTKAIMRAKEEMHVGQKPQLTYREGRDANGTPCVFWLDDPETPAYKAVDCMEGRNFLAILARSAGQTVEQCAQWFKKWAESSSQAKTCKS